MFDETDFGQNEDRASYAKEFTPRVLPVQHQNSNRLPSKNDARRVNYEATQIKYVPVFGPQTCACHRQRDETYRNYVALIFIAVLCLCLFLCREIVCLRGQVIYLFAMSQVASQKKTSTG